MSASTDQLIQFYDHSTHHHHHHHVVAKSTTTSPSSSSSMILTSLIPKASKPLIKRRSRASKRTPTTLLNANTSNFRALVQQFTGCPTIAMPLGVPIKGPITLNFQRGTREMHNSHHNNTTATTSFSSYYYSNDNNQALHHPHDQQQQQALLQEQQQNIIVDDRLMMKGSTSGFIDSTTNYSSGISSSSSMEVSDDHTVGFDVDLMDSDDFSLHDLIAMNNALSNDIGYFV